MYSQDVVFRQVEITSRNEDESKKKGLEKMEFEPKNEGFDSFEEKESSKLDDEVDPIDSILKEVCSCKDAN